MSKEAFKWYTDMPDYTCWEKLHFYYVPKFLFPSLEVIEKDDSLVKKSSYCGTIKNSSLYAKREKHLKMFKGRETPVEVCYDILDPQLDQSYCGEFRVLIYLLLLKTVRPNSLF